MESDVQFNVLLRDVPMIAQLLVGVDPKEPYRFFSKAFKDLKFTADGILDYDGSQTAYIVEFQAHPESGSRTACLRGAMERLLYQMEYPNKEVRLVVIYLSRQQGVGVMPYRKYMADLEDDYFQVYYLDEIIAQLRAKDPDHPAVLVFAPLLEAGDDFLKQQSHQYIQKLQRANQKSSQKDAMIRVFVSWFALRFTQISDEEVKTMLRADKIEETPFYRVIFSEGEEKGEEKGEVRNAIKRIKQDLDDTQTYFTDGDMTQRLYQRRMVNLKTELAQMEQRLEELEHNHAPKG